MRLANDQHRLIDTQKPLLFIIASPADISILNEKEKNLTLHHPPERRAGTWGLRGCL